MTNPKFLRLLYLLLLLPGVGGCSQPADSDQFSTSDTYGVVEIVSGLGEPWGMTFVSDREMLITEKSGAVKRLDTNSGKVTPVAGAPSVFNNGQGGLLDIAAAPDYDTTGWLYITYSKPLENGAATALARARLSDDSLVDLEDLFVSNHVSDSGRHFGSRITFDGKGHIFFTHGDRGDRPSAQDLGDHGGSVLRLNLDGSVPADNPFVGQKGAMPEIWSYGHRNPQGIDYDFENDRLWVNEHGPRGGDEINLVEPRKNYGWPVISYGKEYTAPVMVGESTHKEGMEQPVKYYVPSIAPGSLVHYAGKKYPGLAGSLLSGALKLTHLNRIVLNDNGEAVEEIRYLGNRHERIRDIVVAPDDSIYLSTDSGKIWKLLAD